MTARILTRGPALLTAAALLVGAGSVLSSGTASAGTYVYDLSTEAIAVQSTMNDPNLPLGLPFSVGSYGAGSRLDSNGGSQADAGAPYSPLVSSLPSTGNGLAQSAFGTGLPVVPSFPGYVSAKDPVLPVDKQDAGGYELVATALPKEARGKASLGAQSETSEENNAFAVANSIATDERIFTEGAAGVHALTLSGILDIFNVSSYASLRQEAGGEVVPVTTTSLGTVTFAGLSSGVTGDGLTAFGSAPTPLDVDGLRALNEALKPAGISFTYLPEQYRYTDGSTSTGPTVNTEKRVLGVTSGALRIVVSNTSDRGTTSESITIGQIVVSATGNALNGAPTGGAVPGATGATGAPGVEGGAGLPASGLGSDLAAAPGFGLAPDAAGSGGTPPTQSFVPAAAFGGSFVDEGRTDLGSFYLFLALAGLIALAGSQVVRVVAVRRSA